MKSTPSDERIIPFPNSRSTTVGKLLLDRLYQKGVEHIFGIPGDYIIKFDKLIEEHPIRLINSTRENTAGIMADAYARLKGIGVACITYGVGINILNATAGAFVEGVPLVIISGAAGTEEFKQSPYRHHMINQTTDHERDMSQMELFKQVTVDQAILSNPNSAASEVDRVLHACTRQQKPVYIELPRDKVDHSLTSSPLAEIPEDKCDEEALQEALKEAHLMLERSERPVLWVGREIASYGLAADVLAFAEGFAIPIVSTLLGKTVVDEKHPLFAGVYQGQLSREEVSDFVEETDCLFMLGVLRTDLDTGFYSAHIGHRQRVVANIRRVAIAHHEFPEVPFSQFVRALCHLPVSTVFETKAPKNSDRLAKFDSEKNKSITTARMLECLQAHLTAQHIVATDCGDCLFAGSDLILGQNAYLSPAYFASMGYGVPAAVGGAIAEPERRVIALVGDGGFQMTATELTTALRYEADPIIIVMNNHGYGTERPLLEGAFNDIMNWNYAQMPALLGGGHGVRVTREDEFEEALVSALKNRGVFTIIEVELNKLDFSPALNRFKKFASKTI